MLDLQTLIVFVGASAALALAPGPDNLYVLTQAARSGASAGVAVTLGLCTGLIGHTCAVAFGVAVLFQSSAFAFTALKFVGAGYLIYLAWGAIRAAKQNLPTMATSRKDKRALFLQGIVMNLTNPKVALFFLAFLPQFADATAGPVSTQLILLGVLFAGVSAATFITIAVAAGATGQALLQSARAQKILNTFAAALFIGLAVKLLTLER